ncbi:MAG: 3-(cis-5,6-dihydroxycyclohexa-1,3-dien-1-yl)propanoate dehydrogenase [Pseudonocardia sp.]|uniref:3-(cis-5,6-dihydroxycyclohexa-1, 3-dien-1-yl)propanoate dehydrogenase n=1 Tax=unclassified Pseudonocardia TaxID=2619320 RepID=UPI00086D7E5C|nr:MULTISPECIES: 3-(cis-5,6-dihydroxycyclohexa-1,3-dien-1-yl)propanoate dehydrogenase [unclassified Pseudonocardia]MBN9113554.1 3-(cis-5,6-dihydroxycyclohexa-1,3-dien-1-yl)propanoate dehydrogenase [Pseudonocardia sp.]ODU28938.1 MAG: 3-(cis-5,6-dihydroxycyclohexa-1,3-dien-1-yl)propanoate dehydrogenase [Pseudonocardia sp. SCN 72-51]ODU99519.1 MAG: 3-(cis-5,6-dihydroxycyclohexa-1,3-dien-1-yl)propanoate dehydrogenase [Pseudonocardia sp. SCN 73-27]
MGALDGRRALVVGGGSGIGRAVLSSFFDEGAQVGVLERDPDKCAAVRTELPSCVVAEGDATQLADTQQAVDAMVRAFGGLDCLVSCVGIFDFYRGLGHISGDRLSDAFDEMFRVNVLSQLTSVHAALPHLTQSGGSVILTLSSSAFYPGRGGILYVTSKFALRGAVIALAHELAPAVRVNGVAPGGTTSTRLSGLRSLGDGGREVLDGPERLADLKTLTPLQLAMSSQDHTASYVFLASDGARGITGTFLHPDGGMAVKA